MKISYHKKFLKQFSKLPTKLQIAVEKTITQFQKNPFYNLLNNHPLSGRLKKQRSISVTGDIRIIFEEHDEYMVVIFLRVGSHSQLYK